MDLKNASAVCLISLFSATLVLLIARALDLQTAARLEPQLERIAQQLETIRTQGGIPIGSSTEGSVADLQDGLIVYYFHGNTRCATCRAVESQSLDILNTRFKKQLDAGQLTWKTLNYEQPAGEELATRFDILASVVVLVRMKDSQIDDWKRLDAVLMLADDPPAFADYLRTEIIGMLNATESDSTTPDEPAPDGPVPGGQPADVPAPVGIPVPE
jgi:hypothetical protein